MGLAANPYPCPLLRSTRTMVRTYWWTKLFGTEPCCRQVRRASGHSWLVVEVVHDKMHIHEVIKGFGHLRELDLLREVSCALDEIDELSGEDDLSLIGVRQ
jgi:hypothetical protein